MGAGAGRGILFEYRGPLKNREEGSDEGYENDREADHHGLAVE
jgi:hypothetical protein